jgi:hypothetical protein
METKGCINFEETGKMIAVCGKKTLYLNDKPIEDGMNEYKCKGDITIQQIPDKNTERSVLYITGQSGSGKSFYTKNYIVEYHKMYPKNEVYIFSSLADDPTLDKLKYTKRIKIKEQPFLDSEIGAIDFSKSLCIFDDCDVISNKIIKLKVYKLLNEMLEIGRHHNVSVIFTSHNATMGLDTKRILNECHSITLFPKNLGGKTSKYLLDGYVGMDKDQIKKLKKVNSRWVTILKTYPQMVLSEKEAYVLNPTE